MPPRLNEKARPCWTIDNSASLLKLSTGDIVLEHCVGKIIESDYFKNLFQEGSQEGQNGMNCPDLKRSLQASRVRSSYLKAINRHFGQSREERDKALR